MGERNKGNSFVLHESDGLLQMSGADYAMEGFVKTSGKRPEEMKQ